MPNPSKQLLPLLKSLGLLKGLELLLLVVASPLLLFPTILPTVTIGVVVACILLVIFGRITQQSPILPNSPHLWPIIVLVLMLIVSLLVTADPDISYPKAANMVLGVLWWRYLAIRTEVSATIAMLVYFGASAALTAIGFIAVDWPSKVRAFYGVINTIQNDLLNLPDAPGAGVHPNQFAGMLLMIAFVPLCGMLRTSKPIVVILNLCVSGVLFALLALTQSRSAYVAALLMLALFTLMVVIFESGIASKVAALTLIAGAIGAIVIYLRLGTDGLTRQFDSIEETIGSLNTIQFRFEVWEWAIVAMKDFAFTGTGFDSFSNVVHRLYPIAIPSSYDKAHAHNLFLQVGLDLGVIGLVAYLAMIGLTLWMCWVTYRRRATYDWLALGIAFGIVAVHIFGLTDLLSLGQKPTIILWMGIGTVAAIFNNMYALPVSDSS